MNLDEAKQLYADRMLTRFLPMIPVPKTDGMTPEQAAKAIADNEKIIQLVRKSCWDTAHDLFEVLKLVAISIQVDDIADQAASIAGSVASSGAVTGAVETTADVNLAIRGRTKAVKNADGSYDIDPDLAQWIATKVTNNTSISMGAVVKGDVDLVAGNYALTAARDGAFSWNLSWNGVNRTIPVWGINNTYTLNGGEAGNLTITLGAVPAGDNLSETIKIEYVASQATGNVSAAGSIKDATASTTGTITQGSATLNKLVMRGLVKFHQAPTYLLTRTTNNAGAQDLSIARGGVPVRAGDYTFVLAEDGAWAPGVPMYSWRWNGMAGDRFKLEDWPKGIVIIDGGQAGVLTFTPGAEPPSTINQVDRVTITVANPEEVQNG